MAEVLRWWRQYRTSSGSMPVREFVDALDPQDSEAIRAAMRDVALFGRSAARHLRGDIYEVRVRGPIHAWRVLFSAEGSRHHVLLAHSAFEKKTQKRPDRELELAERRLRDWRSRGR